MERLETNAYYRLKITLGTHGDNSKDAHYLTTGLPDGMKIVEWAKEQMYDLPLDRPADIIGIFKALDIHLNLNQLTLLKSQPFQYGYVSNISLEMVREEVWAVLP